MRIALPVGTAFMLLALGSAAAATDVALESRGYEVTLSARGEEMTPHHNTLVLSRAGRARYRLTAPLIEIVYRGGSARAASGPDLIVTDYAGGAHCCYTVHVIGLGAAVAEDKIAIRDSELELDRSTTPPRLRFYDFAFAYWKASFADSPAPLVILAWDAKARRYLPDIAAMRRPAPSEAEISSWAAEVRAKLLASPADSPDPALWGRMLDLIYAGNAAAAQRFFDLAWPPARPGKAAFRAEFTRQLHSGALWRRYRLGSLIGADRVFR